MKDLSSEIKAHTLKNAIEFGKADASRILPKLFQHGLEKKDIIKIMPEVQCIVRELNALSKAEQEKMFAQLKDIIPEHIEKERVLPELPEANNSMLFRLAPYPSGALHIGNAKTYLLNALYAEKYKAKLLLVMDDTIGSEEKQIAPEAYELIEDGFQWLGVNYQKPVIYKSERLELYYEYAEKLIKKDAAYICKCPAVILRKNREQGKDCTCRARSIRDNQKEWKNIFTAEQGKAVLRIKTSMQHPNPAFRDRVLFKISDRKHSRVGTKYRVWPTLEMSWAIDDHELGITHIIRGNDLMIETDMEKFIWNIFGWKHPVTIHAGLARIEGIEGAKLSKSKAQQEVKSGEFIGWDDPRTWSMQSLKRRGIKPDAVKQFVHDIGLNKQDITIPIDTLYALNRQQIDADTERYVFIDNPVKISVKKSPEIIEVEVPLHPDKPDIIHTVRVTPGVVFISKKDAQEFKGKEVRLLHLYNIQLSEKGTNAEFTSVENKQIPKLTWTSFGTSARVLMPDGVWVTGIADETIASLKEGNVIQFERFGFCRFDKINKGFYEFWFAHR